MNTLRIGTDRDTMTDQYRRFFSANTGDIYKPLDCVKVIVEDTGCEHVLMFSPSAHCHNTCVARKLFSSHVDFNSICHLTGCSHYTGGGYITMEEVLEEL